MPRVRSRELPTRRRNLMTILAGAVAYPLFASAQQKTMPVIGFLSSRSADESEPNLAALHRGLSETGYVDGQNAAIEYRWAGGRYDQLPSLAADLVGRNVNVIVAAGGTLSARAAKNATSMIPIVFTAVADPVGTGLVASLARPGGNLTGVSTMSTELTPKLLELLSGRSSDRADCPAREPQRCRCRANDPRRPGSCANQSLAALHRESEHRS